MTVGRGIGPCSGLAIFLHAAASARPFEEPLAIVLPGHDRLQPEATREQGVPPRRLRSVDFSPFRGFLRRTAAEFRGFLPQALP